ncbi:hypothetical protein [Mycobacteroides salmoniphilum]|uniref:hypothetical protein n=1 Tax=Mycobacteroides salmoniphilum TaxID=404941 RepID=UPI0009938328|nr:hypothetical protein [Mycobacteroides salmoniphilum]
MSYAPEILAALRDLCLERQAVTKTGYLTDSEYAAIDAALEELRGAYVPGVVDWRGSLRRCLFG